MRTHSLPLEEKAKIESEAHYAKWRKGCYHLLLSRTLNCYGRKKTAERRKIIQESLKVELPTITDELLSHLYRLALRGHERQCRTDFENSGYQTTRSESAFLKTAEGVLQTLPELASHIEMYPSNRFSKDLPPGMKMAIGVHVPDFLLFGIKKKGASSVAFEIDGDAHVYKYSKDLQKDLNLSELDIFTISIPNDRVTDKKFIEAVFRALARKRSGALDKQIMRNKRKIWAKTVACQLSLETIEQIAFEKEGVQLNLVHEAREISNLPTCPRRIRAEANQSLSESPLLSG